MSNKMAVFFIDDDGGMESTTDFIFRIRNFVKDKPFIMRDSTIDDLNIAFPEIAEEDPEYIENQEMSEWVTVELV